MRRHRNSHEAPENHERWLVSYADFITLMFAFFVVMFGASQADKNRIKQVSEAVNKALEEGGVPQKIRQIIGGTPHTQTQGNAVIEGLRNKPKSSLEPDPKIAELAPSLRTLTAELEQDIKAGRIQINLQPRGLVISLKQAAFFPSGDDRVAPEGYGVLDKLAKVIHRLPNPVRLEGHTDSMPIHNDRFRSNWELSAARSIAMLQILNEKFSVPVERMAVVGYAETVAVDTNQTEAGRARNRRVDITILNESAALKEAGSTSPHAAK